MTDGQSALLTLGLTVFFIVAMGVQAWWINPNRRRRR